MRLLLDTHALIWFWERSPRLPADVLATLEDSRNDVFYSAANVWEMAIKSGLGKLKLKSPLDESFRELLEQNGFEFLPVEFAHAAKVAELPLHHGDPFDRLLIAQAMIEGMRPVSNDPAFDAYPVKRLW